MANQTPADPRALAEEVLARSYDWVDRTLARALLAALDERDFWRAEATTRADERHAATCDRLEMEKSMLRARADRDALLADLPHALDCCDCKPAWHAWDETRQRAGYEWPEAHTTAIARLEGRNK